MLSNVSAASRMSFRLAPGPIADHWGNAAAAAALLLTCLTALLSWRTPAGDPMKVDLQAYRGGGDLVYTQRLGEISTDGHEGWSVWDCPNRARVELDDSKTPPELWAPQKAYMDARKQSR